MSETKIVVPEGMITAAWKVTADKLRECLEQGTGNRPAELYIARIAVEAALEWLSENPPEITTEMVNQARKAHDGHSYPEYRYIFCVAFLAPEPEYPDDVLELLRKYPKQAADVIIAAYRLGQKAGRS